MICNENSDIDETMDMFLNNLVQILNRHAPIRAQARKEFHYTKKTMDKLRHFKIYSNQKGYSQKMLQKE